MARVGYLPPGRATGHGREQPGVGARRVAVLSAIVTLSAFDRLLIAALLTSVSKGLAVSVGLVSLVATVHFLSYGFAQIGHGWLSDRSDESAPCGSPCSGSRSATSWPRRPRQLVS